MSEIDLRSLKEYTAVEYCDVQIHISAVLREALKRSMREICRIMQERDVGYADCWTHGMCHWDDGPQFTFGESYSDCFRPLPMIARVEVPAP